MSLLSVLLLIPVAPFAYVLLFVSGFDDTGSPAAAASTERGLFWLKVALGGIALLFITGLVWALSGQGRADKREKRC